MNRVSTFAIALAAAAVSSGAANAATLFFQTVATSSTSICAAPCYQVRMFIEDPTRSLEIQAIQMDVDVVNASPATLPVPPATNTNAAAGNFNMEDAEENILIVPWNQGSTVGASQQAGFDAHVDDAGDALFSVNSLSETIRNGFSACPATGTGNCVIVPQGLMLNRIYLGRFNITGVTPGGPIPFGIRVGGILGDGPAADDLMRLDGGTCTFDATGGCAIPEPAGTLLLGAALLGVALHRRCAPGSSHPAGK